MNTIIISLLLTLALGLLSGLFLMISFKKFYVQEDPRVEMLLEALPGANCGACGYSGCVGYAEALAGGKETNAAKCGPGVRKLQIKLLTLLVLIR